MQCYKRQQRIVESTASITLRCKVTKYFRNCKTLPKKNLPIAQFSLQTGDILYFFSLIEPFLRALLRHFMSRRLRLGT